MIVNPLSNVLGAEVLGVDLARPLDARSIEEIITHFGHYQVLVFRGQKLEPEQQIAACRQFGDIEPHPLKGNTTTFTEMTVMSNVTRDGTPLGFTGPPFALWHSDLCYLPKPAKMTFLYAHTVPDQHGDTWFADMYRAYDELPDDLRRKVEGRRAVFSLNHNLVNRCKSKGYHLPLADEDVQPDSLHPVIRTHPLTRRKAIFVNWAHTDRIEDYSDEDSLALLDRIYEHSTAERYIYRHHYQQGDVIVWDNASTIHTHCPDAPIGDRIMLRVVVAGAEPFYEA